MLPWWRSPASRSTPRLRRFMHRWLRWISAMSFCSAIGRVRPRPTRRIVVAPHRAFGVERRLLALHVARTGRLHLDPSRAVRPVGRLRPRRWGRGIRPSSTMITSARRGRISMMRTMLETAAFRSGRDACWRHLGTCRSTAASGGRGHLAASLVRNWKHRAFALRRLLSRAGLLMSARSRPEGNSAFMEPSILFATCQPSRRCSSSGRSSRSCSLVANASSFCVGRWLTAA